MILPSKYVSPERSMLGIGGRLLAELREPTTISALWDRARAFPEITTFERFVLGVDLLFLLGAVEMRAGLLSRRGL